MRNTMRRRVITAVTISSALVLSAAPAAPAAVPTGRLAGFTQIAGGWQLAPPDPEVDDPGSTACQPPLSVTNGTPQYQLDRLGGGVYYAMDAWADSAAYVPRWVCGSIAVIAAFRIVDEGGIGTEQESEWMYEHGDDLVYGRATLAVIRPMLLSNPAGGVTHVQTGAWWGRRHSVTGKMVYYPAGCLEDVWAYTVAAHDDTVPAQNIMRHVPCVQPPLPAMELL